ncbi:MAG: glycosyltransferase [Acidobacteria bacterium]|nr:glycosyltransferase [Acidobacteriota bacterium]
MEKQGRAVDIEASSDDLACSVVIASFSGEDSTRACLESIAAPAGRVELIVATNDREEAVGRLQRRFPWIRFLPAPSGTPVFKLRSLGVARAQGQIVVLIEDHCIASEGWIEGFCAAVRDGFPIVGGTVQSGARRVSDWALFCCEYAAFMPPVASGMVPYLSAVNTAYRRELLAGCQDVWKEAFYENEVHDALAAAGHTFRLEERARVKSHLTMPPGAAVSHLFSGGRHFGHYRGRRSSLAARLLRVLLSPAVPLVLLARIFRIVAARRPDQLGATLLGLPLMFCFLAAWSAGEAVGYLTPWLHQDSQGPQRCRRDF